LLENLGAIIVRTMLPTLDSIEAKLAQLLDKHQALATENLQLRQRLLALENANRSLSERLTVATERVESLIKRLS
jgi:cell division septum initiation protein DivIVA